MAHTRADSWKGHAILVHAGPEFGLRVRQPVKRCKMKPCEVWIASGMFCSLGPDGLLCHNDGVLLTALELEEAMLGP
eukprot:1683431-Amphidinium_carterae.1